MASIIANTGFSVAGRAIGLLIGVGITAFLGRALGVEQFGQYSLVLSFGAILHVCTDWGLYLTLTRDIARHPEHQQRILGAVTALRAGIFAIVFMLGAAVVGFIPRYNSFLPLYLVAAGGFLLQSLSQLLMGVFQAHAVVWKATVGDLVGRGVQLVIVLALVGGFFAGKPSVTVAMLAFTGGAAVSYLVHVTLTPHVRPWRVAFAPALWKGIMKSSWPLGIMLLLNAIYFRVDTLMLSWWRPAVEVGWYGLAYRVVESGLFIPAAFGGILLPKLSMAHIDRSRLLEQALHVMVVAGGGMLAILSGAATALVTFLVGQAFEPAGVLLMVLGVALATMFLGNMFGFTLVALNKQRQLLYVYAGLAAGNVAANALLIPQFGAMAAAWTTVVTEGFSTLIAAVLVYRSIPYAVSGVMVVKVMCIAGISGITLHYLLFATPVVPAICAAAAVYGLLSYWAGLLQKSRITLLLQQ